MFAPTDTAFADAGIDPADFNTQEEIDALSKFYSTTLYLERFFPQPSLIVCQQIRLMEIPCVHS